MDDICLFLNMLSNTWLDYIRTIEFTEDEEDQVRDKAHELGELMNELYMNHYLEVEEDD